MVREAEDAEYLFSSDDKEFTGTAVQLLQAIYKAESLPVKIRLYAASKAADYEPKLEMQYDDTGHAILILPSNRRDIEDSENREWIGKEFDKHWKVERARRDNELRRWIEAGKLSEAQALLACSQWIEAGDPEWKPIQPNNTAVKLAVQYIAPPMPEDKFTAPELKPKPNG
jgi:hypothetical protein